MIPLMRASWSSARPWLSLALALVLALKGVVAAAGLACALAAPAQAVTQAPLCHEIPTVAASDERAAGASSSIACVLACALPPPAGHQVSIIAGGLPDRDWREGAPLPPVSPALAGLERPPRSA